MLGLPDLTERTIGHWRERFAMADTNSDGLWSPVEFEAGPIFWVRKQEELRPLFQHVDRTGNGHVTQNDLKVVALLVLVVAAAVTYTAAPQYYSMR
jgi:Ca2+-binding EF-hand superfamily protein